MQVSGECGTHILFLLKLSTEPVGHVWDFVGLPPVDCGLIALPAVLTTIGEFEPVHLHLADGLSDVDTFVVIVIVRAISIPRIGPVKKFLSSSLFGWQAASEG